MKESNENSNKLSGNNENPNKGKQLTEINIQFENYQTAENLGEGRWRYHGKTYKEESI
ncbi:MAG TPA: hypothetical protein VHY08_04380 [Bacillota bacterium]|nr:hypothetical protein [Bacillota bacterium]